MHLVTESLLGAANAFSDLTPSGGEFARHSTPIMRKIGRRRREIPPPSLYKPHYLRNRQ